MGKYLEWAYISWCQLSFDMETLHSFERRYFEINKVSLLKFYFTTLQIRITFLSRLGCLESFSDHMHLLFSFSENIWSEYFAFSGLGPVQWFSGVLHFL